MTQPPTGGYNEYTESRVVYAVTPGSMTSTQSKELLRVHYNPDQLDRQLVADRCLVTINLRILGPNEPIISAYFVDPNSSPPVKRHGLGSGQRHSHWDSGTTLWQLTIIDIDQGNAANDMGAAADLVVELSGITTTTNYEAFVAVEFDNPYIVEA